jgi:Flp pilus assembly secretin CpaC
MRKGLALFVLVLGLAVVSVLARSNAQDAGKSAVRNEVREPAKERERQFLLDFTLIHFDQENRMKTLAMPQLATLEGKACTFIAGGEQAVTQGNTVELVPFGTTIEAKVQGLKNGRVKLDATIQVTKPAENNSPKRMRYKGSVLRTIETVRLGETVKMEIEAVEEKGCRYVFEVKVEDPNDKDE